MWSRGQTGLIEYKMVLHVINLRPYYTTQEVRSILLYIHYTIHTRTPAI